MFSRRKDPAPNAPRKADGAKLMAQVCILVLTAAFLSKTTDVLGTGIMRTASGASN